MDIREELRQLVVDRGIKLEQGVLPNGNPCKWVVDCKEIMLVPRGVQLLSELLFQKFKTFNCRHAGGPLLAGAPLVSFLSMKGIEYNYPIHSFIIRKEPKSKNLQKQMEGDFVPGSDVVLVDDLINSGETMSFAIETLARYNCRVIGVLTILKIGNDGAERLRHFGVRLEYLYEEEEVFLKNKQSGERKPAEVIWQLPNVNNWQVNVPRSSPVAYNESILIGTNECVFYSLNQETGEVLWKKDLGFQHQKGILSSPIIADGKVFFGAYNGFLYCLDASSGKSVWEKKRGDWIGSSPCTDCGSVYVGIEYGQRGGVLISSNMSDGNLLWSLKGMKHYIHSSPAIDKKNRIVLIGCNDYNVYAANADTGELLWKREIGMETKAGFAIDEEKGLVYFGSHSGCVYCLESRTGKLVWQRKLATWVYSTPEIVGDTLVFSTVSRRIFSLNRFNGSINWYFNTDGDIYSYTISENGYVWCGCDDGFLYKIDHPTGNLVTAFQVGYPILSKPLLIADKAYLACKGAFICIKI